MGSLNSVIMISDVGITETIYISNSSGLNELIFTLHKN